MKSSHFLDSPSWKRTHDIGYWLLIVAACVVFYIMNVLTTLKEDDLAFSLIEGEWTHVRTLADYFRSHYCHYLTVNGRSSDIVGELFCGLLGKPLFNIANTLVFGLMMHLLSLLSTGRRSVMVVAMFLAFFGCCFPIPGETMLWLSGSCNYMWAVTLSLLLVYCLQRHQGHGAKTGWGKTVLLMLLAVFAGSFNEGTSLGFFAGLFLYYLFNRDTVNRTVLLVMGAYLLGILIIAVCPATWNRATSGYIVVDMGWRELLSSRWFIFHEKIWRFYTPVLALIVGVVALCWKGFKPIMRNPWTYILLCSLAVMFLLGIVQERPYTALATVGFVIVAMGVDALLARWPLARLAVAVVGIALFAYTGFYAVKAIHAYKVYDDQTASEIVAAPSQAVLRERQFDIYSRFIRPMKYNSLDFFDRELVYRGYYEKENVQFVTDSVYDRYHSGRLLAGATVMPLVCDHPEIADTVLSFPDQDYMAIVLKVDFLPPTYQQARYYFYETNGNLDAQEVERRRNYAISAEYTPLGYYPLRYQGKHLLICPLPEDDVASIVISFEGDISEGEMTLNRK